MKAIVHVDKNWGIGRGNSLMFRLPADMKFFKDTTTGNTVVMGANTLRSFPGGRPLKDRLNIVLSSTLNKVPGALVAKDENELFKLIVEKSEGEVYVIGGARVYELLLPYCDSVLVTKVDAVGDADAFFPDLDRLKNFVCQSQSPVQLTNGYNISFCTYVNRNVKPLP